MVKRRKPLPEPKPVGLWQFAKEVSPCRWRAYGRWYNATRETLTPVSIRIAELEIKKYCGPDGAWATPKDIQKAYDRRAEYLRNRARDILTSYLPHKVRESLLSGRYQVQARREEGGDIVLLIPSDITSLSIDLKDMVLTGSAGKFVEVSITPIREGAGRRKGNGAYNDMPLLKEMRQMIEAGKARSVNDAAKKVAHKSTGNSPSSNTDRIRKAYKSWEKDGFPALG